VDLPLQFSARLDDNSRHYADPWSGSDSSSPVLFMTSYTPQDLTTHGIDPKGSRVLRKPFMPAELVRVVREAIRA
jgi:DNA-binding response OmpR family regulator